MTISQGVFDILEDIQDNHRTEKRTHSEIVALAICIESVSGSFSSKADILLEGLKSYGITHKQRSLLAKQLIEELSNLNHQNSNYDDF